MAEKLNYNQEERRGIVGWAFISAIAALPRETAAAIHTKDNVYDVELIINGVPCSFAHIMRRLDANIDDAVAKKAAELIEQKLGDKFDIMDKTLKNARQKIYDTLEIKAEDFLI